MVLPLNFFTALPNPTMLGFMSVQSLLMMYFAGVGFQYGKRKISAMSNEDFNKLDAKKMVDMLGRDVNSMAPTLLNMINLGVPMTDKLIDATADVIERTGKALPDYAIGFVAGLGQEILQAGDEISKGIENTFLPPAYGDEPKKTPTKPTKPKTPTKPKDELVPGLPPPLPNRKKIGVIIWTKWFKPSQTSKQMVNDAALKFYTKYKYQFLANKNYVDSKPYQNPHWIMSPTAYAEWQKDKNKDKELDQDEKTIKLQVKVIPESEYSGHGRMISIFRKRRFYWTASIPRPNGSYYHTPQERTHNWTMIGLLNQVQKIIKEQKITGTIPIKLQSQSNRNVITKRYVMITSTLE